MTLKHGELVEVDDVDSEKLYVPKESKVPATRQKSVMIENKSNIDMDVNSVSHHERNGGSTSRFG